MKKPLRINYAAYPLPREYRGFTILESFVSMILVSTLVAISIPALRVVNLQRKSIDERVAATSALANLGERIAADNSWSSLTPARLNQYQTETLERLNLREPELSLDLVQAEIEPTQRQVQIRLSWKNPYGEPVDPLLLSLWFYRERSSNE